MSQVAGREAGYDLGTKVLRRVAPETNDSQRTVFPSQKLGE